MKYTQTVFDLAAEYVECLNNAPNGWGQHIHPRFGQSHYMLRYMNNKFGKTESAAAITLEFKHQREIHDKTTTTSGPKEVSADAPGDRRDEKNTPYKRQSTATLPEAHSFPEESKEAQHRARYLTETQTQKAE